MVIVTIEYDSLTWTDDFHEAMDEFAGIVESSVGRETEIELAHVQVRVRPYGKLDRWENASLFVHVETDDDFDTDLEDLASRIRIGITDMMRESEWGDVPFNLWVRYLGGYFTEK